MCRMSSRASFLWPIIIGLQLLVTVNGHQQIYLSDLVDETAASPYYNAIELGGGHPTLADDNLASYLALPESHLVLNELQDEFGFQSPTTEISEGTKLFERINNLKRQMDSKEDDDLNQVIAARDHETEPLISPPVNDPYEFELAANSRKNESAKEEDLVILNDLVSRYVEKLFDKSLDSSFELSNQDDNRQRSSSIVDSSSTPASRYGGSEYIDHPLALNGHQYVQGGAGEGRQLLGPDGTFENVQVIKSDHAVPSYCDPPNPCPIGFTAEDGCLENFINSASFSREYQAKQQCSCDNEHSLFNCASPISTLIVKGNQQEPGSSAGKSGSVHTDVNDEDDESGKLGTFARTIQNRFGSLSSIQNLISSKQQETNSYID